MTCEPGDLFGLETGGGVTDDGAGTDVGAWSDDGSGSGGEYLKTLC